MGQVIAFKPRARTSQHPAVPIAGGAQILFFLGVRYSRMEDARDFPATQEPDQDSGQGGGRKRRKRARA
jgi:hypothetical protein